MKNTMIDLTSKDPHSDNMHREHTRVPVPVVPPAQDASPAAPPSAPEPQAAPEPAPAEAA